MHDEKHLKKRGSHSLDAKLSIESSQSFFLASVSATHGSGLHGKQLLT